MTAAQFPLASFLVRFYIGLFCSVYLHKKWGQKVAYLAEYPFLDSLGAVVIYLASQLYIVLLSIISESARSFTPLYSLLLVYFSFYFLL